MSPSSQLWYHIKGKYWSKEGDCVATSLELYRKWTGFASLDGELKAELEQIRGDEEAIQDRFYKSLEFGTGGMRGIIGAGTNRINVYTVRKATEGLARYLLKQGPHTKAQGVAIAYDCRYKSAEFADEAALVLARNGIKAYVFDGLRPTPELSFAVRELSAAAGIVITASHNPPEYNGYKVYGPDGGQVVPAVADAITAELEQVPDELSIDVMDKREAVERGLYETIGQDIDDAYQRHLKALSLNPDAIREQRDLCIVYTPLHGTGYVPVREGLKNFGFRNVAIVEEQAKPDAAFSTVDSPNPEEHAAFALAMELGKETGADLLMATDPDTDRVGVAVKDETGEYTVLTGNQLGALLLEYILSQRQAQQSLPENGVVLKTIVTSELGRDIASHYGLTTIDTLTGFKFIGEKIKEFHETGEHTFLFGYEESYGYLIGDFARDKDGVQACLMAAEMAAYYKAQGKTLYEQLQHLFKTYGYYREDLVSLTFKGKSGAEKMDAMLDSFRKEAPTDLAGQRVTVAEDYLHRSRKHISSGKETDTGLPKSNVLRYTLADGSWFCIRPSGTEPKVKLYFSVKGISADDAAQKLKALKASVLELTGMAE